MRDAADDRVRSALRLVHDSPMSRQGGGAV